MLSRSRVVGARPETSAFVLQREHTRCSRTVWARIQFVGNHRVLATFPLQASECEPNSVYLKNSPSVLALQVWFRQGNPNELSMVRKSE